MTCIKTGIMMYYSNYNCTLHGDLYRVNDTVILRSTSMRNYSRDPLTTGATHVIEVGPGDEVFDRLEDLNILVVPDHCVTALGRPDDVN